MATVVDELIVRLRSEADTRELKQFREEEKKTGVATVALGNLLASAAKQLIAFGVTAAKSAVRGLKDLVFGTAELGDEIAKTGKRFDVSARDLQRLRFAAERTGTPIDALTDGFKDLKKNVGDAIRSGTGPAVEALKAMGTSAEELQGVIGQGLEPTMTFLADRMEGIEDPAVKASVQMALMGDAGVRLNTLFVEGGDAIKGYGDRAEELGGILSDDTLAASESFQDTLADTKLALGGLKNEIGAELLPVVQGYLKQLLKWVKANRSLIKERVQQFVEKIVRAATKLAPIVLKVVENVGKLVEVLGSFGLSADQVAKVLIAIKLAMGGLPGLFAAVGFAAFEMGQAIGRAVLGVNERMEQTIANTKRLKSEISRLQQQVTQAEREVQAARDRNAAKKQQLSRLNRGFTGVSASSAQGRNINASIEVFGEAAADRAQRQAQARALAAGRSAEEAQQIGVAAGEAVIDRVNAAVPQLRATGESALLAGASDDAVQQAVAAAIGDVAKDPAARSERRKRGGGGRGAKKRQDEAPPPGLTAEDLISGKQFSQGEGFGRGALAKLGGQVVTIDNSRTFSPRIDVKLEVGGDMGGQLSDPAAAARIAGELNRLLEQNNRDAFAFFTQGDR